MNKADKKTQDKKKQATKGAEIEYTLSVSDIIHFNQVNLDISPQVKAKMKTQHLVAQGIMAAVFIATGIAFKEYIPYILLIFVLMVMVDMKTRKKRLLRSIARKLTAIYEVPQNSAQLGDRTLTVDEKGLRFKGFVSDARLEWEKVTRIVEKDDYLFIYENPVAASVINRRNLLSGDFDTLKGELSNYKEIEKIK